MTGTTDINFRTFTTSGPRSKISSEYCRSRGPEFDPGPVPYFCGG